MIGLAAAVAAAALALSAPSAAPAAGAHQSALAVASERTILERRVDALSDAQLLAAPAPPLFDARRQHAASRYRLARLLLLLAALLVPALALFRLWISGTAATLRDALRRTHNPAAVPAFVLLVIATGWLAAFPFNFLDYRVNRLYGLTRQPPAQWFGTWFTQALITGLVLAAVVVSILWLVDRTRLWYLYAIAGILAVTVAFAWVVPILVTPLLSSQRLVDPATLDPHIRAAVARTREPVPIYVGEVPPLGLVAGTSGLWNTTRLTLGDYVVASASAREKAFIIARGLGQVAAHEPLRTALIFGGFGVAILALAIGVADRVPFRTDDDPLSRLGLVAACALVFSIPLWLLVASYLRAQNAVADEYALAVTRDKAAAVRSIVRSADELLVPYCPGTRFFFLDVHRAPGTRIAAIRSKTNPCASGP